MSILAGCDYLANIPRLGIGWALKYVQDNTTIEKIFDKIEAKLKKNGDYLYTIPKGYREEFQKAKKRFNYQLIFNTETQRQERLTQTKPIRNPNENLDYAGKLFNDAIKHATCKCKLRDDLTDNSTSPRHCEKVITDTSLLKCRTRYQKKIYNLDF
jgi:5'-3' exonuclease